MDNLKLEKLPYDLTVCKVESESDVKLDKEFCFVGKTDEEISLVCITADTPSHTIARDDGWKCFRVHGVLDFALIGILSEITAILAKNGISIFALSTYNTDYILVKAENFEQSTELLSQNGYEII